MNTFILPEQIRGSTGLPMYHQIYSQLKKELFFGNYDAGSRFFSIRDLRAKYEVNAETVRAAIDRLIEDGFVTSKPMSGIYVNSIDKRRNVSLGSIWFCQLTGERDYPFYIGVLAALQRKAASVGMNVIVNHGADISDLERWFKPETGDGLVVSGDIEPPVIRWLQNTKGLRYVVVGNYELPADMPNVHIGITSPVYRAMEVSARAGKRKVAVIANSNAKVAVRDIRAGIGQAVSKGLVEKVGEVIDRSEDGYTAMLKLEGSGCDSVLVTEAAFFGLCRYVFEHRVGCPEKLFVIRFGKNEDKDVYHDIAAVNVMTDKGLMAEKIMATLFSGGPARSELDCEVVKTFQESGKSYKFNISEVSK